MRIAPKSNQQQSRQSNGRQAQRRGLGNERARRGGRVKGAGSRRRGRVEKIVQRVDRQAVAAAVVDPGAKDQREIALRRGGEVEEIGRVGDRRASAVSPVSDGSPPITPKTSPVKVTVSRLVREPIPSAAGVLRVMLSTSVSVPLPSIDCSPIIVPRTVPVPTGLIVLEVMVSVAI